MLRPAIAPNEGLLFDEGRDSRLNASIHMFFMRFPIAVIWINSDLRVVDTCQAFPGARITLHPGPPGTSSKPT